MEMKCVFKGLKEEFRISKFCAWMLLESGKLALFGIDAATGNLVGRDEWNGSEIL